MTPLELGKAQTYVQGNAQSGIEQDAPVEPQGTVAVFPHETVTLFFERGFGRVVPADEDTGSTGARVAVVLGRLSWRILRQAEGTSGITKSLCTGPL
ncbi:MAG: hypothetical protein FJ405_13400 [Verrucomicrobia bacterium]|nr:hypothetical protein [Verrucomicrobiota bacterium]